MTYPSSFFFSRLLAAFGLCLALVWGALPVRAQGVFDINLWQSGYPNSNGRETTEPYDAKTGNYRPSIRVWLPADSVRSGAAVVCCPGGGYTHLALSQEGNDWAAWFNERGIALVVLTYRMPNGHREVPVSDAREAIRIVRDRAALWGIDPHKVGIMGSSAGGHLASTMATHNDSVLRPDFQILFYPVITMDVATHGGSRQHLLGEKASQQLRDAYSNEKRVTAQTPPAILLLCNDDRTVPPLNSVNYYLAMQRKGIRNLALHVYPRGGHGWGCRSSFPYHDQMLSDLDSWLRTLRLCHDNTLTTTATTTTASASSSSTSASPAK